MQETSPAAVHYAHASGAALEQALIPQRAMRLERATPQALEQASPLPA